MLKEYRILKLFFLFLFFLPLSGCTTSGMGGAHEVEDITPGEKPTIESYEGGVWYQIDKLEEAIKSDEKDAIDAKSQALTEKAQPLAEKAQAKASSEDGASEATDAGDDVVDADFEEVKEDK